MEPVKIFIDRQRAFAVTKKAMLFGLGGLGVIILFYKVLGKYSHRIEIPMVFGGVVLIALIYLYRNLILLFKPCFILSDEYLVYFNAIGYNKYAWNSIATVTYSVDNGYALMKDKKGNVLNNLNLNVLSVSDQDVVIKKLKQTGNFSLIGN